MLLMLSIFLKSRNYYMFVIIYLAFFLLNQSKLLEKDFKMSHGHVTIIN